MILTIAGSDCSGGAGVQADLKTVECNGGFGASAIAAITVQDTTGVRRVHPLPADLVSEQIRAVLGDLGVAAVKSGMLADRAIVRGVADALRERPPLPYVCDPILGSTTGTALLDGAGIEALLSDLLPLATLLTPNAQEAGRLTGMPVRDAADAERSARRLLAAGAAAVLVKGGHLEGDPGVDVLVTPTGVRSYASEWIDTPHTHGTGCIYSAAIATWLGRGADLERAVEHGKRYVTQAIAQGLAIGRGRGPADPCHGLHEATVP